MPHLPAAHARARNDVCLPMGPLDSLSLSLPAISLFTPNCPLASFMTEPQIDPSLLDEGSGDTKGTGRGTKRKTRSAGAGGDLPQSQPSTKPTTTTMATGSGSGAGSGAGGRTSGRLASKSSNGIGVGVGIGVGARGATRSKGKGKETDGVEDEPARGEEENLMGSEYKLRGGVSLPSPLSGLKR